MNTNKTLRAIRAPFSWKDSASLSLSSNHDSVVKNGSFYFELSVEEKEYLESHLNEIDEWCEIVFEKSPHTIVFEPFWNGVENVYTCNCYFKNSRLI